MEYKDYYQILGVDRDASDDDIKRAYRKLARRYHPDVSKEADAADRFKDVSEAYEVLKDPEKRAAYDQVGQGATAGQGFEPPPGWSQGFDFQGGGYTGGDTADFSEFFESLFGRGFRSAGGRGASAGPELRGRDQTARVEIDLEDAFSGGQQTVAMSVPQTDEQGRVTTRERRVRVTIPKGVRAGQQLRLSGQGSPGLGGGPAGDLYLEIGFRPHAFYRLDGADLSLDLPVAPWEAALGATVKTPTPAGPVSLTIPAGSNNGRRLRLKGRGMPGPKPGNLYATLRIALPPQRDEQARRIYGEMAEKMPFNPRERLGV